MNDMLSEFSREIKSHLEDHMEKTQLNNETDDRKKVHVFFLVLLLWVSKCT